jgi:DNA-binding MarR family transcriptional regulator
LQRAATIGRTLEPMQAKGWIKRGKGRGQDSATYRLTRKGHAALVPLLAAAKAHESDALSHFPDADARQLKQMLKALMQTTQPMRVRKHGARLTKPLMT